MREYTEKEYWDGLVPDELFEEYLNKYGYEYTPPKIEMKIPNWQHHSKKEKKRKLKPQALRSAREKA